MGEQPQAHQRLLMEYDVAHAVPPMLPAQLVKSVYDAIDESYKWVLKVNPDLEADGAPIFPPTTTREEAIESLQQNWKNIVDKVEKLSHVNWHPEKFRNAMREYIETLEREGNDLFVETILKALETLLTPEHQLSVYKTLTGQEGNHSPGEELWDGGKFEYCKYVDGEQMYPVLRLVFVHDLDVADVVYSMIEEMEKAPQAFGGRTIWYVIVQTFSSVQFG